MMLVLTMSGSCIKPCCSKESKTSQTKHAEHTSVKGATYHHGWRQVGARANFAHYRKTWVYIEGKPKFHLRVKTQKKKYLIFSLFFSPNFDIKRKSKHLFFVSFQEQLLKLKYSTELRKSKILSTLIFHIASFFKEKNNACRRESNCFFYRNHLLEQKSAFLRRRNMNFFRQEFRIALWPKWRR